MKAYILALAIILGLGGAFVVTSFIAPASFAACSNSSS